MVEKIKKLGYQYFDDFQNPDQREMLQSLVRDRQVPENDTYLVKMIDIQIKYEMEDKSFFINTLSLTLYFLVNEQNNDVDNYFCIPTYPFEMKTEADFDALKQLFDVYRNDVKTVMADTLKSNQTEA